VSPGLLNSNNELKDAASTKRRICLCWNNCQWCNCQCVAHSAQSTAGTPTHSWSDGTLTRTDSRTVAKITVKDTLETWLEIKPNHAAIEVFKAVWLRTQFLWDMTHHYWITGPQSFEGTQCLHFKRPQRSRGGGFFSELVQSVPSRPSAREWANHRLHLVPRLTVPHINS